MSPASLAGSRRAVCCIAATAGCARAAVSGASSRSCESETDFVCPPPCDPGAAPPNFDVAFLNAELVRTGQPGYDMGRVVDTLALARRKHPGASNSLDVLCQRYGIDSSRRIKHGALLDAEILAEVYIELIGGKQADLDLTVVHPVLETGGSAIIVPSALQPRPVVVRLTDAERAAHLAFVASLGDKAIWREYLGEA